MNLREAHLAEVGFFRACTAKSGGQNRPLAQILAEIRDGQWRQAIGQLRRLPPTSTAYDQQKKRLPCFMLSASTGTGGHKAADIDHHSGLLQIDVDGLSEAEAVSLRDRFGIDLHIFSAWLSPGALGVKAAMCISPDQKDHKRSFNAAQGYIRAKYGVEIDPSCSDPCRLCFVSHDPDLRINEESSSLPLVAGTVPPTGGGFGNQGECPPSNSSKSLPPESESCILHNKKFFEEFPGLLPFYQRHVLERLGKPQPGHRNKALVELVAGTFCVVHPRFVLEFADIFFRANFDLFAGYPHSDYRREAENLLAGCLRDYPLKSLHPKEAAIYHQLRSDSEQAAFRICRSLAHCESEPAFPPPLFYLSAVQLGYRIDELMMTAWRVMKRFEKKWSVIQEVEKGQRRAAGEKAVATRWRWVLSLN